MNYDDDDKIKYEPSDRNEFINDLNDEINVFYLLKRLSPKIRQIVELKAQGYKYQEIGNIVGKSENAIKQTFWRIRKKIVKV